MAIYTARTNPSVSHVSGISKLDNPNLPTRATQISDILDAKVVLNKSIAHVGKTFIWHDLCVQIVQSLCCMCGGSGRSV